MNTVTKKTRQTPTLSPGEYEATVTNVTIKQVDAGINVFWTLNVNGESHPRPNFVRRTKDGQEQVTKDAKLFGITVASPQDLTESNFKKVIGKRVKIKVTNDNSNRLYPNIYFEELIEEQESVSTWNC